MKWYRRGFDHFWMARSGSVELIIEPTSECWSSWGKFWCECSKGGKYSQGHHFEDIETAKAWAEFYEFLVEDQ